MSKSRYRKKGDKDPKAKDEGKEEGGEQEEKWTLKGFLIDIAKDIAIAFAIMIVIVVTLTLYTGNWPPLVVVESQSMMHGSDSELGAIDTGDLVLVKAVEQDDTHDEITTWVDHKEEHYGTWGDVIIYMKNGGKDTPVIHRAVVWLEANYTNFDENTFEGASFDIPSMHLYNQTETFYIREYPSFQGDDEKITLAIDLNDTLHGARDSNQKPLSGFITKGDNNGNQIDQSYLTDDTTGKPLNPVRPQWIIGKAKGELPWFGLMKLYVMGKVGSGPDKAPAPKTSFYMLIVTIIGLIILAIALDFVISFVGKKIKERKKKDEDEEEGGKKGKGSRGGEKGSRAKGIGPRGERKGKDTMAKDKPKKEEKGRPLRGRPAPEKPGGGKKDWKMDGRRRL